MESRSWGRADVGWIIGCALLAIAALYVIVGDVVTLKAPVAIGLWVLAAVAFAAHQRERQPVWLIRTGVAFVLGLILSLTALG